MFAQDEIQVAEHPLLGNLREALLQREDALVPLTVELGRPTPILIEQVPRQLDIDTTEIYGRFFATADSDTLRRAAQPTDQQINLLAMEAPIPCGNEIYDRTEITHGLQTAFSGFRAVVLASRQADSSRTSPVTIHTGFWGCGAYGGNRHLMSLIQLLAATWAGVDELIFYRGEQSEREISRVLDDSRSRPFRPGTRTDAIISHLVHQRFPWGTPDGN